MLKNGVLREELLRKGERGSDWRSNEVKPLLSAVKFYEGHQINADEMSDASGTHRGVQKYSKVLVAKSNGKKSFDKHQRRREAKTKLRFKKKGFQGVDWIRIPQDRKNWWLL
jgi:hypothetical protein